MNHQQVCHIWANQSKPRGKGFNIYFEGDTIYSYGSHFPIARHVTNKRGERAILFTTRRYSSSTGKHISYTRQAIRGDVPVFHVAHPDHSFTSPDIRALYEARVAESMGKALRARTYIDLYISDASGWTNEANAFAAFYGFRWRLKMPANVAEALECAKEQERKRQVQQRKAMTLAAAEWRAGARASLSGYPDVLMRIRGAEVETSKGARFPVKDAARVFSLIESVRERGEPWQRNGHMIRIGDFQIDRIEPTGDVKAGCHFVKWAEIAHCAALLDLLPA